MREPNDHFPKLLNFIYSHIEMGSNLIYMYNVGPYVKMNGIIFLKFLDLIEDNLCINTHVSYADSDELLVYQIL